MFEVQRGSTAIRLTGNTLDVQVSGVQSLIVFTTGEMMALLGEAVRATIPEDVTTDCCGQGCCG